jgi:hypothetical protein
MRNDIHSKISKVLPEHKMKELVSMFSNDNNEEKWRKAIHYLNGLDKIRNQNIGDYLEEFRDLN